MTKTVARQPLFQRLRTSLEEGIRFARGELDLKKTVVPSPPPEFQPRDVLGLRRQFNMSQRLFARTLNVSAKTVQSWEQGTRRPSQAALRLLQVLRSRPELVGEVMGIGEAMGSANQRGRKGSS
jgi:putative transcriptional regulator